MTGSASAGQRRWAICKPISRTPGNELGDDKGPQGQPECRDGHYGRTGLIWSGAGNAPRYDGLAVLTNNKAPASYLCVANHDPAIDPVAPDCQSIRRFADGTREGVESSEYPPTPNIRTNVHLGCGYDVLPGRVLVGWLIAWSVSVSQSVGYRQNRLTCGCQEPHPRHATRRYSWMSPPSRSDPLEP